MKSTITDVARQAGVSIKTVSRVLNKEPNVTQKTRERVLAAATSLNYKPNLSARSLAGARSYMLALIYDNPSANYIANFQHGATDACRVHGFHIVIEPVDIRDPDSLTIIADFLQRLPMDGVILTPPWSDNADLIALLNRINKPYVLVAPSKDDPDSLIVKMDNTHATYELTTYLINMGHKDIGFIKGHPTHGETPLRYEGFIQAMTAAGLTVRDDWIKQGDFSFDSGVACAEEILSGDELPSAIFASNDDMAAGVISVAGRRDLAVPGDISVAGFDDIPLATTLYPQLTTIAQPIYEMGVQAAKSLIMKSDPQIITLDYRVVVRGSTIKPGT